MAKENVATSLFGRNEICSSVKEVTPENVSRVLERALAIHSGNSRRIDYLYKYVRGEQPVLGRKKKVRKDICNKIVENHALEVAQFTAAYFMGEPVVYVRRGDREGASDDIARLNDYMFYENEATHDMELANWMALCGVGYKMVIPDEQYDGDPDEAPFNIDVLDPRDTFVVYYNGFGHKPLMAVRQVFFTADSGAIREVDCVYTDKWYFEIENGIKLKTVPHGMGCIPIFEYRLNQECLGSFEPAIPLLDAINTIASNRVDGVEQFVQSFLKFKNCEIDENVVNRLAEMGAISIKSTPGMDGDVDIVVSEMNQQQTQTLVDYLYDEVLMICGVPITTKADKSTSNTGNAVILQNGWSLCEGRAKNTEQLFKRSEKEFLRAVLKIVRASDADFDLKLSEVECKFTRRQYDNLLTKTQSLLHMLEAGLNPLVAISTCGLFNDPQDVYQQSQDTLHKWDFVPLEGRFPRTEEDLVSNDVDNTDEGSNDAEPKDGE